LVIRFQPMAQFAGDMTGEHFGHVTVQRRAHQDGQWFWWVLCDCGTSPPFVAGGWRIRRADPPMRCCNCLRQAVGARSTTHGATRATRQGRITPEYRTWAGAIQRCTNPKTRGFHRYGGRGISVCDRWRASFADFFADMGERPSRHHSLDRIDTNGHYEPGNCRWATPRTQQRNKRSVRMLTVHGERDSLAAWAERFGLSISRVHQRLRLGWSEEEAIATPPGAKRASRPPMARTHWLTMDGERLPLVEWARRYGVESTRIATRIRRGWTVERAITTPVDEQRQEVARAAQPRRATGPRRV
jgi:hypothetical protein